MADHDAEKKQTVNTNGYIIKLYKKISSLKTYVENDKFDFITYMNFDGMLIDHIYEYDEYQKISLSQHAYDATSNDKFIEQLRMESFCEVQKVNIYRIGDEEDRDIFFHYDQAASSKMSDKPFICITVISFFEEKTEHSIIINNLKKIKADNANYDIDFQLFGTLSAEDYVLVSRSSKITGIYDFLLDYRDKETALISTYSVLGLDKESFENVDKHSVENIGVSIRMQLHSKAEMPRISNCFSEDNIDSPIKKPDLHYLFGKYDIGVAGVLEDFDKLAKMHDTYLDLSNVDQRIAGILSTNTRFVYNDREKINRTLAKTNSSNVNVKTITNGNNYDPKDLLNDTIPSNYCNVSELRRFIIRIIQTEHSVYSGKSSLPYIKDMLVFARKSLSHLINATADSNFDHEQMIEIIRFFNLLIDNRISANFCDFESPQKNIHFAYSSSKMLKAYSALAKTITRSFENENVKFCTNIIVDSYSKITLFEAKPFESTKNNVGINYIFIGFPVGYIYNLTYSIPFLMHELGHLLPPVKANCFSYMSGILLVFGRCLLEKQKDMIEIKERLQKKYEKLGKPEYKNFDKIDVELEDCFVDELATQMLAISTVDFDNTKENIGVYKGFFAEAQADAFMLYVLDIKAGEIVSIFTDFFLYTNTSTNIVSNDSKIKCVRLSALILVALNKNRSNGLVGRQIRKTSDYYLEYEKTLSENMEFYSKIDETGLTPRKKEKLMILKKIYESLFDETVWALATYLAEYIHKCYESIEKLAIGSQETTKIKEIYDRVKLNSDFDVEAGENAYNGNKFKHFIEFVDYYNQRQ
jgi:hypothetical protein